MGLVHICLLISNHMKNKNKQWIIYLCIIAILNSCKSYKHTFDCEIFLYKPLEDSPAYVVKLPSNSSLRTITIGESKSYNFSYHDAIFFISDEYCYYAPQIPDTSYNFLRKMQRLYQKGEKINIPREGMVYESGCDDGLFWKFCLFYNLEKANYLNGLSNIGVEHLYVGYLYAFEEDTAMLNDCISSAIRINKPINKHKANKIIKCDRYFTTKTDRESTPK